MMAVACDEKEQELLEVTSRKEGSGSHGNLRMMELIGMSRSVRLLRREELRGRQRR
jgi:hypothetical protein